MMGYTTTTNSIFPPDLSQSPENVRKVLDFAGWMVGEAALEMNVPRRVIDEALKGVCYLSPSEWRLLIDKAGRRSFDHDGESVE